MAITVNQRTQLVELYVALAGRAPDISGLGYWAEQLDSGGFTVEQIAQFMFDTPDAKALYPRVLTASEITESFYRNVLGRPADAEGATYWTEIMVSDGPVKTLLHMIDSVKAYSGTDSAALTSQKLLKDKVDLGTYFALELRSDDLYAAQLIFNQLEAGKSVAEIKVGTGTTAQYPQGETLTLTSGTDYADSTGVLVNGGDLTQDFRFTATRSERILATSATLTSHDVFIDTSTLNQ